MGDISRLLNGGSAKTRHAGSSPAVSALTNRDDGNVSPRATNTLSRDARLLRWRMVEITLGKVSYLSSTQ